MHSETIQKIAEARARPLASRYTPAVAEAHHHAPICMECYPGRIEWAVAWGKVLKSDPDPVTWQGYCQKHQEARLERARLRLLEGL